MLLRLEEIKERLSYFGTGHKGGDKLTAKSSKNAKIFSVRHNPAEAVFIQLPAAFPLTPALSRRERDWSLDILEGPS